MKTVSDLGERKLISLAFQIYKEHNPDVDLSDDCAIIPINDEYFLATSDMISEKTHIPQGMTPWQIGWFVTAINLSDIAAKGATPLGLLLSLGMPKSYPEASFLNIIKGASSCATQYDTAIIGGDTKEHDSIVISGTALGKIHQDFFMSRKGAKPGDVIAVTGSLGKAAAGFYELQNFQKKGAVNSLCEPMPRIKEGRCLAKTQKVHCSMDLSDGLSSSLYQLAELNNVGFQIDQEKIPISQTLRYYAKTDSTLDEIHLSLHFGGDYELFLTVPSEYISLLQNKLAKYETSLTVIGKVTEEKKIFINTSEKKNIVLPNLGYEHLTKE